MTGELLSRRSFLAFAGGSGVAAFAGCVSSGARQLRFSAYDTASLADDLLLADPTERRARFALDYPREYKRDVYDELVTTGSVTVLFEENLRTDDLEGWVDELGVEEEYERLERA